MNVRTEALAYRIWGFANPKDWNCTIHDIAEALNEGPKRISAVCSRKRWSSRLRSATPFYLDTKACLEEGWSSEDHLIGEEEFVE